VITRKIRTIPTEPGVYLYKNAEGEVIYVGKAKNLRSRVASYFHEGRWEDSKTGTLVREAVDVDYIVVANNKEALALENNLIKQRKPRFNILLRDDKTYPYVKLTWVSAGRASTSPAACARTAALTTGLTSLPILPIASSISFTATF
jgi:excinuclease ABC subunit C